MSTLSSCFRESQETASSSSSSSSISTPSPPIQEAQVDDAVEAPKPTHHVTANPHLNRARARLGRLAKRWQPTEDRDNKVGVRMVVEGV